MLQYYYSISQCCIFETDTGQHSDYDVVKELSVTSGVQGPTIASAQADVAAPPFTIAFGEESDQVRDTLYW